MRELVLQRNRPERCLPMPLTKPQIQRLRAWVKPHVICAGCNVTIGGDEDAVLVQNGSPTVRLAHYHHRFASGVQMLGNEAGQQFLLKACGPADVEEDKSAHRVPAPTPRKNRKVHRRRLSTH